MRLEVESASTVGDHRGRTPDAYLGLESLRAYWIDESEAPRVLQYTRDGDQWTLCIPSGMEAVIRSRTLDVEIPLRDGCALVFDVDEWDVCAIRSTGEGHGTPRPLTI